MIRWYLTVEGLVIIVLVSLIRFGGRFKCERVVVFVLCGLGVWLGAVRFLSMGGIWVLFWDFVGLLLFFGVFVWFVGWLCLRRELI